MDVWYRLIIIIIIIKVQITDYTLTNFIKILEGRGVYI